MFEKTREERIPALDSQPSSCHMHVPRFEPNANEPVREKTNNLGSPRSDTNLSVQP